MDKQLLATPDEAAVKLYLLLLILNALMRCDGPLCWILRLKKALTI